MGAHWLKLSLGAQPRIRFPAIAIATATAPSTTYAAWQITDPLASRNTSYLSTSVYYHLFFYSLVLSGPSTRPPKTKKHCSPARAQSEDSFLVSCMKKRKTRSKAKVKRQSRSLVYIIVSRFPMDLFQINSFARGREALPKRAVLPSEVSHLSISKKGRPMFSAALSGSLPSLLKGALRKCNSSTSSTYKKEPTSRYKKDGDVCFQSDIVFLPISEEVSTISKKKVHPSLYVKSKRRESTGSPSLSSKALNLLSRKMRRSSANDVSLGECLLAGGKSSETTLPCTESTQASPKQQKKRLSSLISGTMRKCSTGSRQVLADESLSFGSLKSCCLKKQLSPPGMFPAELEETGLAFGENDDDDGDVFHACFSSSPKRVTFNVVEVREYVPSISHHPMVKDGYAVELGWDYSVAITLDVNAFEDSRPPAVRTNTDLKLGRLERLKMLRASGHDVKAIRRAREATLKGYDKRNQTLKKIRVEDRKEEAKRGARDEFDRTRH
jgi:hypothetical protein